jgi:hypothetical protein
MVERIESFEDIIDLEVGDTNLTRARALERDHDLRQLFIKYEGNNPTGTQKDRIAFAQVMDALTREYDTLSLGISPGLHVALSKPNVEFADPDGHLDFLNDPFSGLFSLENGWLIPSNAAGMGTV